MSLAQHLVYQTHNPPVPQMGHTAKRPDPMPQQDAKEVGGAIGQDELGGRPPFPIANVVVGHFMFWQFVIPALVDIGPEFSLRPISNLPRPQPAPVQPQPDVA